MPSPATSKDARGASTARALTVVVLGIVTISTLLLVGADLVARLSAAPGRSMDDLVSLAAGALACLVGASWVGALLVDVLRLAQQPRRLPRPGHHPGNRRTRLAAALLGLALTAQAQAAGAAPRDRSALVAYDGGRPAPGPGVPGPVEPISADLDAPPTPTPSPAHAAAHRATPVDPDLAASPSPTSPPPAHHRPQPAPQHPPRPALAHHQSAPREHVVVRGDTLWDIARADLGPGATPAEVERACRAWHLANSDVIGADPDLLLPGQVLHAPPASAGRP